jgi:Asp-tRNA(Asn)/Glu-tRNA(Gln) amidotransferase A subunit family amidase
MKIDRREMMKTTAAAGAGLVLGKLSGFAAEYANYDALGLAALVAKKQITPGELLSAVRGRVEALNPKLNAFCHLFFEKAEAQIKQGLPAGAFRGVPFALKDLGQYLNGTITSAGSRVWKNAIADYDSTYVTRLKQAGLVIFGKTNSPELGLTTTTERQDSQSVEP